MNNRNAICLLSIIALLSLVLSGCITVKMSISVQTDGSSEVSTMVGLSSELMEMVPEGENPLTDLETQIREQLGEEVQIEQWSEDGTQWIKAIIPFSNLEELNTFMREESNMQNFSLQKEGGLLKERFVFDGDFSIDSSTGLGEGGDVEELDIPMDLLDMYEFFVSINLPGSIVETNGTHDEGSGEITWSVSGQEVIQAHAISETWKLDIVAIIIIIVMLILLAASIYLLFLRKQRKKGLGEPQDVPQHLVGSVGRKEETPFKSAQVAGRTPLTADTPVPSALEILDEIGARQFLEEVNRHLLQGKGTISVGKGAVRILWTDPQRDPAQRGITIQAQDASTILINGQPFPATPDGVKTGLVSCLKKMESR